MNNNQWYYLPPHVQTTITKMIEFGFTYSGYEDYWGWGYWGNFTVQGFCLEIDEGDYADEDRILHLDAIWIETGDYFSIPLSALSSTIAFILSMCNLTGDELSFEEAIAFKTIAAEMISSFMRSHYQSPGQLSLFD